MNVYTYFAQIHEHPSPTQQAMIQVWSDSWRRHGWTPMVLGPQDAAEHPDFDRISARFYSFPTVNAKGYEMACWLRWAAMAMRGGVQTDYDCTNHGFTPNDVPKNDGPLVSIFEDNNPCPCGVSGTAEQYQNTLDLFMSYQIQPTDVERGDQPHVSDQSICQREHAKFRPHIYNFCRDFNSANWMNVPLIHFAHGACGSHDRLQAMRSADTLREWARK